MSLNESIIEDAALEWFGALGYFCLGAEALIPAFSHGEKEEREAIRRLNPAIATSRTLATPRDTLLPKLLSGELSATANLLASTKS